MAVSDPESSSSSEWLVFQSRVPEGFSASKAEHKWHEATHGTDHQIEVTGKSVHEVFTEARDLYRRCITERSDEEYRVIYVIKTQEVYAL